MTELGFGKSRGMKKGLIDWANRHGVDSEGQDFVKEVRPKECLVIILIIVMKILNFL